MSPSNKLECSWTITFPRSPTVNVLCASWISHLFTWFEAQICSIGFFEECWQYDLCTMHRRFEFPGCGIIRKSGEICRTAATIAIMDFSFKRWKLPDLCNSFEKSSMANGFVSVLTLFLRSLMTVAFSPSNSFWKALEKFSLWTNMPESTLTIFGLLFRIAFVAWRRLYFSKTFSSTSL